MSSIRALFPHLHALVVASAIFTLTGCTSTYHGYVNTSDCHPVGRASVRALGRTSLFCTTPWNLYPAIYVRGTTITARDGSFTLHASQYRLAELEVNSSMGSADINAPSPDASLTITVMPHPR